MNVHYLTDRNGHTNSVVVQAQLWQRILDCLKKSPESADVLRDIPKKPHITTCKKPENPLKALLESDFIGSFEAEPDLSENYKTEVSNILNKKYGHS